MKPVNWLTIQLSSRCKSTLSQISLWTRGTLLFLPFTYHNALTLSLSLLSLCVRLIAYTFTYNGQLVQSIEMCKSTFALARILAAYALTFCCVTLSTSPLSALFFSLLSLNIRLSLCLQYCVPWPSQPCLWATERSDWQRDSSRTGVHHDVHHRQQRALHHSRCPSHHLLAAEREG